MKKLQTVMLMAFAVSALSAVIAASASAETTAVHNWLSGSPGVVITANLASETAGSILLEDTETLVGKAAVTCKGILDGMVGAEGKDEISLVLNEKHEEISTTPLMGLALLGEGATTDCKANVGCAEGTAASPIEVWPTGLEGGSVWPTLLFLMENGEVLDLVEKAGYELLCLVLNVDTVDECKATDTEVKVVNNAAGDASTPINTRATPNATCTQSGGKASGVNETASEALITLVSGELLSIE